MPSKVLIAFGSNVGDSTAAYEYVQQELPKQGLELLAASTPLQTQAVGAGESQDPYLNAALLVQTTLSPQEAIQSLLGIEKQLGRVRDRRWGPRTVDLDLLLFDELKIAQSELICPHPRMSFRRFVLAPAAEVGADLIHPVSGCTIGQLLEQLDSRHPLVLWVGDLVGNIRSISDSPTPLGQSIRWGEVSDYRKAPSDFDSGYTICVPTSKDDFDSLAGLARLVVISEAEASLNELVKRASRFSGATLRLDLDLTVETEREVISAIDAMS